MSFKYILYFLLIIGSISCKQEVVHPDDIRQEVDEATDQLQFAIITSNPSANSTATLRVIGIQNNESIKIYNDNYCSNKIADEEATKSILDITLSFVAEDTYDLYYIYTDKTNTSGSCRSTKMSYQYDATAPTAATFSLNTNAVSNTSMPSLQISSLNSGEIVKVYSDSSCTYERLAFTATSTLTVNKYITNLLEAEGTYSFYYSIEDQAGNKLTISSSTCHNASVSYTYDITKPEPSSGFAFEGTVATITEKLLRASNISTLSELKIYQDSTCSTMLCNNTDSASIGTCLINNQSGDYYDNSSDYFIFDATAATIKDYYFKYKSSADESSCLRVNNYLLNNTAGNTIPTFRVVDQAHDNETSFYITANGITSDDTIYIYSDPDCNTTPFSNSSSGTSTNISLGFTLENDYPFHYKIKDTAGNYAYENGTSCFSTGLNYKFDNGAPTDHTQELVAPNFLLIKDTNVEVVSVNGNIGSMKFLNSTVGSTLYVYSGQSCSGTTLASETVITTNQLVDINFNNISSSYISFKEGSSGTCTKFNFMPVKKDGVENKVTIAFTGLEVGATLKVYATNTCSDELHSEEVTKESASIDVSLTTSGAYQFSSQQVDTAGNLSSCIAVNSNFEYLEYSYHKIESVALGDHHTCVTVEDIVTNTEGKLYCWGRNDKGQLGDETTATYSSIPLLVSTSLNATSVSTYKDSNCVIGGATGDELYCFGDNTNGILGTASIDTFDPSPTAIAGNYSSVTHGEDHVCAMTTADLISCWGDHTYGQAGNAVVAGGSYDTPEVTIYPATETYKQISAGGNHTCALDSNDQFACWGQGASGQRGDNTSLDKNEIPISETYAFTKIDLGADFSCALNSSGEIYCWGSNDNGQLGGAIDPLTTVASTGTDEPLKINSTKTFTDLSVSKDKACAIDSSGYAYCWGAGFTNIEQISTEQIFTTITVGSNHICALRDNGQLLCWGNNEYGQLGIASLDSTHIPAAVEFDFDKISIKFENTALTPEVIDSTIDLKYELDSLADQTLYYDNTKQMYLTLAGEDKVEFKVSLTNTSLTDATLNLAGIGFTANGSEDYSQYFQNQEGDSIPVTEDDCPDFSGSAPYMLLAGETCTFIFDFKPSIPRPNGMSATLNFSYSDTDFTYTKEIKVTGYSFRALKDIYIQDEDGYDISGDLAFNEVSEITEEVEMEDAITIATITNNEADIMNISKMEFIGIDKARFDYTGGSYPGTTGTCTNTLAAGASCTLDLTDSDPGSDPYETYLVAHLDELDTSINATTLDEDIIRTITINNESETTATITTATLNGANSDQFKIADDSFSGDYGYCGATIPANTSCNIDFIFKPTQDSYVDSIPGVSAGFTIVLNNNGESNIITIPFHAYSHIFIPEFEFTDSDGDTLTTPYYDLNMSNQELTAASQSISKVITVTNTGDKDDPDQMYSGAKNITVSIIGDDPTHFKFTGGTYPGTNGTCGTELAVGEECTVDITYEPLTTTTFNGGNGHIATVEFQLENVEHTDPVVPITFKVRGYVDI